MRFIIIRANVEKNRETTMARFMNDLNHAIAHMSCSCIIVWS
jgi:hypothetical protein